jgi:hypothetical protein
LFVVFCRKYCFIFLLGIFLHTNVTAQLFSGNTWGFNVGAVFALGNRFQRLGYTVQGFYYYKFVQVNGEIRLYHNLKNLGPKKSYNELVTSIGTTIAYGKLQTFENPFLSPVSNQTKHKNSVSYAYNAYFNKIRTRQQTGTIALQFGDIALISENDIYARSYLDRFRTGAFLLQYQYQDRFQFALNCTMWTGKMGRECRNNKNFPYVGYIDTTGAIYPKFSHGLLSAQFKMDLGAGQNFQANLGIDAEQVRNAVQNRLIHDMVIIPKKLFTPINCHIPMLDTEGNQYLYEPGQRVKKPEFYWNVFSGSSLFY